MHSNNAAPISVRVELSDHVLSLADKTNLTLCFQVWCVFRDQLVITSKREARSEFFCGLTRALEGGLRITPSGGGGAYNAPPPHRSQLL